MDLSPVQYFSVDSNRGLSISTQLQCTRVHSTTTLMQKQKAVEAYYSPQHLALLLQFSTKWVWAKIKAGEFGPGCILIGDDYRVPASGVNAFLERYHLRPAEPVVARNEQELRRKLKQS